MQRRDPLIDLDFETPHSIPWHLRFNQHDYNGGQGTKFLTGSGKVQEGKIFPMTGDANESLQSIMTSNMSFLCPWSYPEIILLVYVAWYNPALSWMAKAQIFNYTSQQFEPGAPLRSSAALACEYERLSDSEVSSIRSLAQTSSGLASPAIRNSRFVNSLPYQAENELLDKQESHSIRPTDCFALQHASSPFHIAGSSADGSVDFLLYRIRTTAEPVSHTLVPNLFYMSPLPRMRC